MPKRVDGRRAAVLEMVARYIHVREQPAGSNRSPEIDGWLRAVGSPLGSPWCAAFLYGCGREALGERWPFHRSGRVQDLVDVCRGQQRTKVIAHAEPGDLIAFYFAKLGRYAHIAILREKSAKTIWTTDGNSIADGAAGDVREGWGVFEKRRPVSDRMLALTWPKEA